MNYSAGKSIEFRGNVDTFKQDLFEASSQFNITIEINSDRSSSIRMVYAESPGEPCCFCFALVAKCPRFTTELLPCVHLFETSL